MANIFKDRSQDPEYVEQFERCLDEAASLYGLAMERARRLGLKDDRAVQAAAFTIWREATDRIQKRPVFWEPSHDVEENIARLDLYASWHGIDQPQALRHVLRAGGMTDHKINACYHYLKEMVGENRYLSQDWPMLARIIWYLHVYGGDDEDVEAAYDELDDEQKLEFHRLLEKATAEKETGK